MGNTTRSGSKNQKKMGPGVVEARVKREGPLPTYNSLGLVGQPGQRGVFLNLWRSYSWERGQGRAVARLENAAN